MAARKPVCSVYQDRSGEWRWRLVINGRIIAESGEGYKRPSAAAKAFGRTCLLAPTAGIDMPPKRQLVTK